MTPDAAVPGANTPPPEGEAAAPQRRATGSFGVGVSAYDFRRSRHVSKERLRTLEAMYERLVRSLEAWLVGRARRQIELRLKSIEQASFGEFTAALPNPCAAFGFEIPTSDGQRGIIEIGHDFAYLVVDRFFGGGGQTEAMNRALTPIERLTVRIVVERIAALLADIWQDFVTLDLDVSTFESVPEMVQGTARDDPVLVTRIDVAIQARSSQILICLPLSVLDKFFAASEHQRVKRMTGTEQERQETREVAEASLRATQVEVLVRLPDFRIPMRSLAMLAPGSVLPTGISVDAALEVHVGGVHRYLAESGRVGKKLAVRITEPPGGSVALSSARAS